MSLPEVQMLWVGGPLSTLERLSVISHLRQGHPVRLFSYEAIPNLPLGVTHEDARAILPESAVFTNPSATGHGNLSMFSNFFRYHLLLQRGGIWSDCDSVCLRPLSFASAMEYFFATERVPDVPGSQPQVQVANGVIKAPAGAPVLRRVLEIAEAADRRHSEHGATGPKALHQAVQEQGLIRFMLAPDVFCPINWWQVPALVSGPVTIAENTFAVHFYNEVWRRNFFDKNSAYDPLSLYERLKAHYLTGAEESHA